MFKHILIPTDGSARSAIALEKGLQLAKDANARVTVITVVEPPRLLTAETERLRTIRKEIAEHASTEAAKFLERAALEAKRVGVPCETIKVQSDSPVQAIINAASKSNCDLILMSSHGRHGLTGYVLSGITQQILADCMIPVLIYH